MENAKKVKKVQCAVCDTMRPGEPVTYIQPGKLVCDECNRAMIVLAGKGWRKEEWAIELLKLSKEQLRAEAEYQQYTTPETVTADDDGDDLHMADTAIKDSVIYSEVDGDCIASFKLGYTVADTPIQEKGSGYQKAQLPYTRNHAWIEMEETIRRFYATHKYIGRLEDYAGKPGSIRENLMRRKAILYGLMNHAPDLYEIYRRERIERKHLQSLLEAFDEGIAIRRKKTIQELQKIAKGSTAYVVNVLEKYRPDQYALHYRRRKRTQRNHVSE